MEKTLKSKAGRRAMQVLSESPDPKELVLRAMEDAVDAGDLPPALVEVPSLPTSSATIKIKLHKKKRGHKLDLGRVFNQAPGKSSAMVLKGLSTRQGRRKGVTSHRKTGGKTPRMSLVRTSLGE